MARRKPVVLKETYSDGHAVLYNGEVPYTWDGTSLTSLGTDVHAVTRVGSEKSFFHERDRRFESLMEAQSYLCALALAEAVISTYRRFALQDSLGNADVSTIEESRQNLGPEYREALSRNKKFQRTAYLFDWEPRDAHQHMRELGSKKGTFLERPR